jgi:hypothetical protein
MMEATLFLAIVLLAGWFVTRPLRAGGSAIVDDADVVALEAARDAKLRELRDAELDYATGKLGLDDYRALDGTLRAEAAELLRRLEDARSGAA